jgi:hypothetical protein
VTCERIHDLAVTAFLEACGALSREFVRSGEPPSVEFVNATTLTLGEWLMGQLAPEQPLDEPKQLTAFQALLCVGLFALVVSTRAQAEAYTALLLARNGPGAAGQPPV